MIGFALLDSLARCPLKAQQYKDGSLLVNGAHLSIKFNHVKNTADDKSSNDDILLF